jgi:indolepyruvate ferredoxin oxidoreductase alpha subunit
MKKFLMGNEAIALGAIHAGVNLVSGYPGTPSTEILETIAKNNDGTIYVEWSVNEKAALEVAAGASYAGARTLVTMKQVGLNVASDPLMSLAYVGVKGGMVIVSADDPGPISSQTEQDTRHFAQFAKLPVFDPSSPEEAYAMVADAFALSEEYGIPVLLRPTTRVCHGCASMDIADTKTVNTPEGFVKDSKWIIFPRLSYQNHLKIEERNPVIAKKLSTYRFNKVTGSGTKGIATGGISYAYTREALGGRDVKLFKIATPHPFPEKLALEFLSGLKEVLVIEELDPVIERELTYIRGKNHLNITIKGKLSGDTQKAGENSVESVKSVLHTYLGLSAPESDESLPDMPIRPPVLCAGCPHRASFYAVKQAMKGQKAVFAGDIGCYTLGNAMPLNMVDTCLCMGAGLTIAQGLHHIEPDTKHIAFIGDSTFFASGITGVINAVYNESDITLIVLDNSTTAMTGNQPHPGTGKTMMGNIKQKISIPTVLTAVGVKQVAVISPLNITEAVEAVKKATDYKGVSAVVFESPCIHVTMASTTYKVDIGLCKGCKRCIRELGCPAISMDGKKALIESSLCRGCSICAQVCPSAAIKGEE